MLLFWSLACIEQIKPLEAEQACEAAAFAIAARTLECTGDADRALTTWEAASRLSCAAAWTAFDGVEEDFGCTAALARVPCPDVEALGGDLDGWLAVDPSCQVLLGGAADTGLPVETP